MKKSQTVIALEKIELLFDSALNVLIPTSLGCVWPSSTFSSNQIRSTEINICWFCNILKYLDIT